MKKKRKRKRKSASDVHIISGANKANNQNFQ